MGFVPFASLGASFLSWFSSCFFFCLSSFYNSVFWIYFRYLGVWWFFFFVLLVLSDCWFCSSFFFVFLYLRGWEYFSYSLVFWVLYTLVCLLLFVCDLFSKFMRVVLSLFCCFFFFLCGYDFLIIFRFIFFVFFFLWLSGFFLASLWFWRSFLLCFFCLNPFVLILSSLLYSAVWSAANSFPPRCLLPAVAYVLIYLSRLCYFWDKFVFFQEIYDP